jgi:NADH-quinone oxidoreductase subunit L
MTIPLIILAFLSIVGGFINLPPIFGGKEWLAGYIGITTESGVSSIALEWLAIIITLALIGSIVFYAYNLFLKKLKVPVNDVELTGINKILSNKFYIDEFYDFIVTKPIHYLSVFLYTIVELKLIDAFVNGVGRSVRTGSRVLKYVQSGSVNMYLMLMVLGIIVVLFLNIIL